MLALHVAAQLKAGVYGVNSTNYVRRLRRIRRLSRKADTAAKVAKEGLLEYLEPLWFKHAPALPATPVEVKQFACGHGAQRSISTAP